MTLDLARLRADAECVVHNRDKWPELVVNGAFERIALLDRLEAAEVMCANGRTMLHTLEAMNTSEAHATSWVGKDLDRLIRIGRKSLNAWRAVVLKETT